MQAAQYSVARPPQATPCRRQPFTAPTLMTHCGVLGIVTIMTIATSSGIAALLLYFAATLLVLRRLQRARTGRSLPLVLVGFGAVAAHALCLWDTSFFSSEGVNLGLFPMASLVAGTGAALVTAVGLFRRLEWVGAILFPLCALSIPPLLWFQGPSYALSPGLGFHVLLSILASAVLGIAAMHSLLILLQHRALKRGHIRGGVLRALPPIQVMESLLFQLLWAGLLFLSAAIVTGFVYVDDMFAQRVAHKTVLTLGAWLLFAMLVLGNRWLGWRALTAVRFTLAGFLVLVLGFFGTQLVLEFILRQ